VPFVRERFGSPGAWDRAGRNEHGWTGRVADRL
jgi:hypothetical protein